VFRAHVLTCFIEDEVGLELRHHIGVENITWECDYPHSDSTWPASPETLWSDIKGLADEEVDLITHGNAMRTFRFHPFSRRPRKRSTVGALRGEALDWDVSPRDVGPPWEPLREPLTQAQKLKALARLHEEQGQSS